MEIQVINRMYENSLIQTENNQIIDFKTIENVFVKSRNGSIGKLKQKSHSVYEHGLCASWYDYIFIDQETLSIVNVEDKEKFTII